VQPDAYCLERAEECDLRAAELADPRQRLEWLRMGAEWRVAAVEHEGPQMAIGPRANRLI